MTTCRLIVCEKDSRWAITMRRCLAARTTSASPLRVYECRSLRRLWQELRESPASVVLMEVAEASQIQPSAAWIYEARRAFPRMIACVALGRCLQPAGRLFFELGAATVVTSPARVRLVLDYHDRHCRQQSFPGDDPDPIWEQLPWPRASTASRVE